MWILVASIFSDAVAVIAIPLYFLFMVVCVKFRHQDPFHSSFFALTFSQGIADLIMIGVMYAILKPPLYYGIFIQFYLSYPLLFGRLQAFFAMALGCSQQISFLAIAFNRFTAVCVPVRHNTIWKRQTTTLVIIVQWLLPLLIYFPILTSDVRYISQSNSSCLGSNCLWIFWANNHMASLYYMITFAYILAIVIVCSVLYALQFRCMWKQRSISRTLSNHTRVELRLALMGATIFAISSSYLFFLITSIVAPSIAQSALDLLWLYFFITVIMSSVNPFILIGMSAKVRLKCVEMFCRQSNFDHQGLEISTRNRRSTTLK
uniref:G-protein coupled receptors family 1 profile domain-containing protein n=1 Tax=Plectus sambesii TaxID=2011161 RepID=A0A914VHR9_9BILA